MNKFLFAWILVLALLLVPVRRTARAQDGTAKASPDSTVVESNDGSVSVSYFYKPVDFGSVVNPSRTSPWDTAVRRVYNIPMNPTRF